MNPNGVEDNLRYTDTMKKIPRHREILDWDKVKRSQVLELNAEQIPRMGTRERDEWQGRYKQ